MNKLITAIAKGRAFCRRNIFEPTHRDYTTEFRKVENRDYDAVIDHLRHNFFADEPLNKAVQLCKTGEGHEELERQCVETMRDGLSIMAEEDGEILGVALNGVLRPGDTSKALEKLKTLDDEKFRKIFTLLHSTTEALDMFSRYSVDSIFEFRIMSVGAKTRGKRLTDELTRRSIQIGKDDGFKVLKADATGKFSQSISKNFGLKTIKEVFYKDYLDPKTGLPIFDIPAPHTSLKIMILRLP